MYDFYTNRARTPVGRNEKAIREYIKKHEKEDRRLDQLDLFDE